MIMLDGELPLQLPLPPAPKLRLLRNQSWKLIAVMQASACRYAQWDVFSWRYVYQYFNVRQHHQAG